MSRFDRKAVGRYRRDGFLVVRGLLRGPRLERFLSMSQEILSLPDDAPVDAWKFYDDSLADEPVLIRVEKFIHLLPEWRRFVLGGAIRRRASELLGERANLFKEKLIVKPAGGDAIGAHQEMHTDWGAYGRTFVVLAIALDHCTRRNGCLELSAGDHRRGLVGRPGRTMTPKEKRGLAFQPVEMEPGDGVFFDAWTPHQSGRNRTRGPRRLLFLAFNRARDGDLYHRYFENKASEYWPGEKAKAERVRRILV